MTAHLLAFTAPGPPVAWGRGLISTRGKFARVITPKRTRIFETTIGELALAALDGKKLCGPLEVTVTFVHHRPASRPAKVPAVPWKLGTMVAKVTRPDIDNLVKGVLDGMRTIFHDDAQVVALHAYDRYAAKDMEPAVHVTIDAAPWA